MGDHQWESRSRREREALRSRSREPFHRLCGETAERLDRYLRARSGRLTVRVVAWDRVLGAAVALVGVSALAYALARSAWGG